MLEQTGRNSAHEDRKIEIKLQNRNLLSKLKLGCWFIVHLVIDTLEKVVFNINQPTCIFLISEKSQIEKLFMTDHERRR